MAARISAAKVAAILREYDRGDVTVSLIAERRGMAPSTVSRILHDAGREIPRGRRPNPKKLREFTGKLHGRQGRQRLTLPKVRKLRLAAGVSGQAICRLLGKSEVWVGNVERGTLRATPARLEAIVDGITALDPESAPTVKAAAAQRCRDFRDPDGRGVYMTKARREAAKKGKADDEVGLLADALRAALKDNQELRRKLGEAFAVVLAESLSEAA